jgi:phthalate 4,5-cis-dihydrodiol dehydrogenase
MLSSSIARIGLVGAGAQGTEFLFPALMQVPNATMVGVADVRAERAATLAARTGAPSFACVEALLDRCAPDALIVACEPDAQQAIAAMAIDRGVAVFVEKPPTLFVADLRSLAEHARAKGVVTGVGMNFRFSSAAMAIRDAIAAPDFGELVHISLTYAATKPKLPMWNLTSSFHSFMLAQTIHPLDLAISLGGVVARSDAELVHLDHDFAFAKHNLTFERGGLATILTGNVFPRFDFHISAVGSGSKVVSSTSLWSVDVLTAGDEAAIGSMKRGERQWRPSPLDSGYARAGYLQELQMFVSSVIEGSAFPASFESLIPVYEVIESALERASEPCAD